MINKLVDIINLLVEKTSKREAEWSLTDDGFLITINGKSYLTLQKYYISNEDRTVYVVNLYNDVGTKIIGLDTEDMHDLRGLLSELYGQIYSQYHKIEETLDDLFNTLNNPTIGKIGDKSFNPKDDELPF